MVAGSFSPFPPCTATQCNVDESEKQATGSRRRCEMTEQCVSACAAYGRVCPCSARVASSYACDEMRKLSDNSNIFAGTRPDFHCINSEDMTILEKLGCGGFSNVNRCVIKRGLGAKQEFAVKYLKRKAMVDLHQFKHGAADLAVEAHFLHALDHPNIVRLHGITAGSVETNFATGKECGFFIVIDRLYETLEAKIESWRQEAEQNTGILRNLVGDTREKKHAALQERCKIALSIAEAMEYLHSKDIVFRDLKPDNLGFDKEGNLKLFDFGLAKELKKGMESPKGGYVLTGNTGSRRYMAPEVAREQPYGKPVDVYSFGILLWELCAARKPFYGYSSGKHMQQVAIGGERPSMEHDITANWPMSLQWLMKKCWAADPHTRPEFGAVKAVLRDILASKDTVPQEWIAEAERKPELAPPTSFGLFRATRAKRSSTTGGGKVAPPVGGFKSLQPTASSNRRARSWGLGPRR